jgi:hypothetical protein
MLTVQQPICSNRRLYNRLYDFCPNSIYEEHIIHGTDFNFQLHVLQTLFKVGWKVNNETFEKFYAITKLAHISPIRCTKETHSWLRYRNRLVVLRVFPLDDTSVTNRNDFYWPVESATAKVKRYTSKNFRKRIIAFGKLSYSSFLIFKKSTMIK